MKIYLASPNNAIREEYLKEFPLLITYHKINTKFLERIFKIKRGKKDEGK